LSNPLAKFAPLHAPDSGELFELFGSEQSNSEDFMGDKSPKSVQKQVKQKQLKENIERQKKQEAIIAKQEPSKFQ
jgi:hypothetical protein